MRKIRFYSVADTFMQLLQQLSSEKPDAEIMKAALFWLFDRKEDEFLNIEEFSAWFENAVKENALLFMDAEFTGEVFMNRLYEQSKDGVYTDASGNVVMEIEKTESGKWLVHTIPDDAALAEIINKLGISVFVAETCLETALRTQKAAV